ncbi:MAG: thioredoxin family protein [Planctomycetota bacterium]|nr:thioredoxin family protein [Planctomycetota bacterium]
MKRNPSALLGLCAAILLLSVAAAHAAIPTASYTATLNQSALKPGSTAVVALVVEINAGLHAQSHTPLADNLIKFEVKTDENAAAEFLPTVYPAGVVETFADLGPQSVYTGRVVIYIPLRVKGNAPPGDITLSGKLTWQACNDHVCFPPERNKPFMVQTKIVGAGDVVQPADPSLFAGFDASVFASSATTAAAVTVPGGVAATQPARSTTMPAVTVSSGGTSVSLFGHSLDLQDHSFLLAAVVAFFAGIIFNVVPCVLPVLPVKAIGFYEASQHNRGRTILLGLVFSLGLIAIFAALGMVVLLSKSVLGHQISWGQQFSYPWFVWGVALVLAVLGFGMLGAFSVELPTSIYGLDFRHDTLSGNFLWGALTALLSTPCTAPLFPPVLGYAILLPKIEGFLLLIIVGAGMASPYLVLSAFPELARRFPRTGQVSELVKQMMGFLLLGSAAFFAGLELVGEPNQWWIVFAVVVWGCLYLVIRSGQIFKSAMALYIITALAVAITAGALVLCLRLTDLLQPHGDVGSTTSIQWQPYTPEALASARAANVPVLIDFTASWCLNCKYVENTVYRDSRAIEALRKHNVLTLKADLTEHDAVGYTLLNQLGSEGIPYTAIYLPGATHPVGLASIYTTDTLLEILERGKGN